MAKTKRTTRKGSPLRKTLKPGQFVRVRLQSGKFTKFRSGRNLIFEVVEKKSIPVRFKSGPRKGRVNKKKKPTTKLRVVRYLNQIDKKTREPIPRKYTAIQYKIFTSKVTREKTEIRPLSTTVTIRLNNKNLIIDQLSMKKGEPLKKLIRKFDLPLVELVGQINTSRGDNLSTPGLIVAPSAPWNFTARLVAMNMIYSTIADSAIRMSPKKYQKFDSNQMEWIDVTFAVKKPQT